MRRVLLSVFVAAFSLALPYTLKAAEPGTDELVTAGQAVDAKPDSPEAYEAFAQVAFRLRRWDEAIARLKEGVARIPSWHAGLYKLAYAYRQTHDFPAAAAAYRRFLQLEPANTDGYFGLGAALQGGGDREGALAAYGKYVELEHTPAKQRFVDQAKAEISKLKSGPTASPTPAPPLTPSPTSTPTATATPPPPLTPPPTPKVAATPAPPPMVPPPAADAAMLRKVGERLVQRGKLDDAAMTYERAVAADPGNLDVRVELGNVYMAQHRYPDAVKVFRAAVERDAGYALGWYNLAHAQLRAADYSGAVHAYREYMRLRPSDPDPYFGLGLAYKSLGDRLNAVDAWKTYLRMEMRPESQRWIDRARHELEALGEHAAGPRGTELKDPLGQDRDRYATADDSLPPSHEVSRSDHERIQRELVADDILPIADEEPRGADLQDPYPDTAGAPGRERLSRYANALAAYRAALDRQASEVAALYQRGAERVLANDLKGAQRAWTATLAGEQKLDEARARLQKARALLNSPN